MVSHPAVIVIVLFSVGCVLFLPFLAGALFCLLKKRKKKTVQETKTVHLDEHKKIKGTIVDGPHGIETVALVVEDDIRIDKNIKKNEKVGEGHASTSGSLQPHLEHKA